MSELSEEAILAELKGSFGRPLRYFDEIGSTNVEATRWAASGAPEGALVATNHQTAGRGRHSRGWFSEPGAALQLSVVLRPRLQIAAAGLLTTAVGVACVEAVRALSSVPALLKWPNDVVVDDRKLAGILVESQVAGDALDHAVVGIGINVRAFRGDVPDEVVARATNLEDEVRRSGGDAAPTRPALLAAIAESLESVYRSIEDPDGRDDVVARATRWSAVLGRRVVVSRSDEEIVQGVARRILPTGGLEVETDSGPVELTVGEITRLRDA